MNHEHVGSSRTKTTERTAANHAVGSLGAQIPWFIVALLIAEVALGLAHLINYLIGDPFPAALSLESEQSVGTWFSSGLLLMVALVAGGAVYPKVSRANPSSWPLLILPLAFLVFSLDEIAMFHERIGFASDRLLPGGTRTDTLFSITGIWMFLLGVPLLVGAAVWLKWFRRQFHPPIRVVRKLAIGMLVILTGALVVEGFSNAIPDRHSLGSALQVLSEELLEMIGITIILWGAYDLLQSKWFCLPAQSERH